MGDNNSTETLYSEILSSSEKQTSFLCLMDLDSNILCKIFSFLGKKDIFTLNIVSKRCNYLINNIKCHHIFFIYLELVENRINHTNSLLFKTMSDFERRFFITQEQFLLQNKEKLRQLSRTLKSLKSLSICPTYLKFRSIY